MYVQNQAQLLRLCLLTYWVLGRARCSVQQGCLSCSVCVFCLLGCRAWAV